VCALEGSCEKARVSPAQLDLTNKDDRQTRPEQAWPQGQTREVFTHRRERERQREREREIRSEKKPD